MLLYQESLVVGRLALVGLCSVVVRDHRATPVNPVVSSVLLLSCKLPEELTCACCAPDPSGVC